MVFDLFAGFCFLIGFDVSCCFFLVVARSWLFEVRVKQVDHEGINGFELPEPSWTISWTEKPSAFVELSECPSMGIPQLDATGGSHGSFPGTMHSHGGALQFYVNPGYRVTKEQISEANVFSIFHQFFVDVIFDECDSNKWCFPMWNHEMPNVHAQIDTNCSANQKERINIVYIYIVYTVYKDDPLFSRCHSHVTQPGGSPVFFSCPAGWSGWPDRNLKLTNFTTCIYYNY